ncbi:hypothetical protein JCM10212_004364 [Sporobolomyces blumeae]
MVQTSESSYIYEIPLPYIILAHNQRYPSPYGTHILSSDVISRSFDPRSNVLSTTRLMNKRGKMPKWAPSFISQIGTSWVLETTEVELGFTTNVADGQGDARKVTRELRTESRNLDHTKIMRVCEWQVFREARGNSLATESITLSQITSELDFWLLRDRVEKFGLSKLPKSIAKARYGLNLVASLLLQPSTSSNLLSSGPLAPYEFDPVPSPLSLALRAKLDEARQAWLVEEGEQSESLARQRRRRRLLRDDGEDVEDVVDDRDWEHGIDPTSRNGTRTRARIGESIEVWRTRWRGAVEKGKRRFRDRVCAITGLLCDEPSAVRVGAGTVGGGTGPEDRGGGGGAGARPPP